MGSKASRAKRREEKEAKKRGKYPAAPGPNYSYPSSGAAGAGAVAAAVPHPSTYNSQYPNQYPNQYSNINRPVAPATYGGTSAGAVSIPVSHNNNPNSTYVYDPKRNCHTYTYDYQSPPNATPRVQHHAHFEHCTRIERC